MSIDNIAWWWYNKTINQERNDNMRLFLLEIITNQSMTVDEALNCLGINMDEFASTKGWDDWDYECLRLEVA